MMTHTFSMKPLPCFLPSFLILASRVVCLSLLALALLHRSTAAEVEIPVTASADIRNLDDADGNFLTFTARLTGQKSARQLIVRASGNPATQSFKTYLQADLHGQAGADRPLAGGKVVLTRGASDKAAPTRLASLSLYGITDHNDQWREADITWNNAPKNDTESPGGVQPKGTVLLAKAQLPGLAAGEPVEFESEELTRYLNWKAGALPDAYGTGAAKDSVATFIVVASDQSPTVRFHSHLHKSKDPEQTTRFRPRVILRRPSPS
jgi:hypothetical protein